MDRRPARKALAPRLVTGPVVEVQIPDEHTANVVAFHRTIAAGSTVPADVVGRAMRIGADVCMQVIRVDPVQVRADVITVAVIVVVPVPVIILQAPGGVTAPGVVQGLSVIEKQFAETDRTGSNSACCALLLMLVKMLARHMAD